MTVDQRRGIDRRTLIKYSAASGAVLAADAVRMPAIAQAKTVRLGYVSPQTGPLAAFAEADNFIIANFKDATKGGLRIGSTTYAIDVVVRDSQSNPNRAAEVAKQLIVEDAAVRHIGGASESGRDPYEVWTRRANGLHLFWKKHYPPTDVDKLLRRNCFRARYRMLVNGWLARFQSPKSNAWQKHRRYRAVWETSKSLLSARVNRK